LRERGGGGRLEGWMAGGCGRLEMADSKKGRGEGEN